MTDAQLQEVILIAREAGQILLKYHGKDISVETKSGPYDFVTRADREADAFIRAQLTKVFPQTSILSEESSVQVDDFSGKVWMVDPLDGTKDFVHKGKGFSVMIGLCDNGTPTMGVVYNPLTDLLYYAEKAKGAYLIEHGKTLALKTTSIRNIADCRMVTRIAHVEKRAEDSLIAGFNVRARIEESSVGLKTGLIAAGRAEFSISTSPNTSKWDTCAPQIILEEAGGFLTDMDGQMLDYKQPPPKWNKLFVASANDALHKKVLAELKEHSKT